jgi:hypothetical protein
MRNGGQFQLSAVSVSGTQRYGEYYPVKYGIIPLSLGFIVFVKLNAFVHLRFCSVIKPNRLAESVICVLGTRYAFVCGSIFLIKLTYTHLNHEIIETPPRRDGDYWYHCLSLCTA